ncbi:MAG: hypothetical protein HDR05_07185 [Lachnospiraceae bacterium]|nr:hypothetical protein [Lachnospiraceae bacterium]
MIKTAFAGTNKMSQPLLHTKKTNKIARQQAALHLLLGSGNDKKRDSLSISSRAQSFSKKSIAALVDKSANVSASELSYYFANYNNPRAILDAINFGTNVECGYNPEFKDYGVMCFDYNGSRQVVPNYAVPKINTGTLSGIHAVNNSLVLNNKSYYVWTASDGRRYPWDVNNGYIGWAVSESLLTENRNPGERDSRWEMSKAGNILSNLAQGREPWEGLYSRKEVLATCEKVGITPGFFSIDAGAGKHTYILQESGDVINVDKNIERWNHMNWIAAGYKEGDIFSIYGNEYAIDSSGHIHVSTDDTFTSTETRYPSRHSVEV